jgi:hypothetical protein
MIRRLSRFFTILIAIAIVSALSGIGLQRASAAGEVVTSTCSSVTISGSAPGVLSVTVEVRNGAATLGIANFEAGPGGAYSATINFSEQPAGSLLTVNAREAFTESPIYNYSTTFPCGSSSSTSGSGGVTFFNPNDGRVDPRPGDRLAIYCNTTANPPTIGVYGIRDDSRGVFLATFNVRDLLRARRITRALGSLGTLNAIAIDANGNFYIAWTGGPYGATGQGIWAKAFNCRFPL